VYLIPRTKDLERTRLIIIQEGQKINSGKLSPRDPAERDTVPAHLLLSLFIHNQARALMLN